MQKISVLWLRFYDQFLFKFNDKLFHSFQTQPKEIAATIKGVLLSEVQISKKKKIKKKSWNIK